MASILSIIPYQHLIPPQNGGQLRCYYLLNQLAQHHKVYLIIFQPESELRLFSTTIPLSPNITVFSACDNPPPPSLFDKLPDRVGKALKYRWMRCKWSGTANSLLLQSYHLTQYILRTFTVDFIWLEHYISLLLIEPFIRTIKKKTIKIFDAHNVDTNLLEQEIKTLLTNSSRYKSKTKSLETANYYETRLNKFVNYFIACSDTDRITLERMNKYKIKGFVIPNGVDSNQRLFDNNPEKANSKNLIFCGSLDFEANRDGLFWFCNSIFPLILARNKDLHLFVVGRGGEGSEYDYLHTNPNIDFIGEVEDVVPFYYKTGVSIVPLRIGSGTRLKILEAMSLGNPVVSTGKGAEGIEYTDGKNILIADEPEQFADSIIQLLENSYSFNSIRNEATQLIQDKYDWDVIGNKLNAYINTLS